ncbi:hypothetical protein DUNSADRAFT_15043 [Dunaliella salina]|uniref:Uncharacterized protein n=1 Tax=Dunaliella salina TaxID=3046 RepID=A0ABQ7G667_DUNSA|nr:hypothetical protein DUNSADRAFT_15043 [Dunaliella salina]|eukprot:KAF5830082.1 hypothetical protein DUNSADRAFT_15043 [Dunaliella salina]
MARALASNCPTPALRLAALHAAANLAGLERVHETGDRRAALLAPVAETLIGDATYMACTSAVTPSPAEGLLSLLEPPFPEQRAAVYRFIAAMALRSWFAAEVVRHSTLLSLLTSPGSESRGVSGAAMPTEADHINTTAWRYAAVESLWLTAEAIQQPRTSNGPAPPLTDLPPPAAVAPGTAELAAARAALTAALPQLRESAKGGPHGRRGVANLGGRPREPEVATM